MGRSVKNPKKHIISCRINEWELESLQQMAKVSGVSISELLRQSLVQRCDQQQSSQRAA